MAAVSEAPNPPVSFSFAPSLRCQDRRRFKGKKSASTCSPVGSQPDGASLSVIADNCASRTKKKQPSARESEYLSPPSPSLFKKVGMCAGAECREECARCNSEEAEGLGEAGAFRPSGSTPLPAETRPKSLRLRGLSPAVGGDGKKTLEIPRFSISLTREEIDEDVWALTGSRPSRRPKKRARNVQKKLDQSVPGSWLPDVTVERYRIADQSESRKEVETVRRFLKFC